MTNINPNDIPAPAPVEEGDKVILSDQLYNLLKGLVAVVLPASATAILAIGALWSWDPASKVAGTIVALTTLLGVLMTITTKKYNKSDAKFDGSVDIVTGAEGDVLNFAIDPVAWANKDGVQLKINRQSSE